MIKFRTFLLIIIGLAGLSCEDNQQESDLHSASWETIGSAAQGTVVNFMMWQGSQPINDYMNNYVVPEMKARYNIDLRISGGQGPEIVQLVMGEREAGVKSGQVDMVWINGETFFQLRQVQGLWGPFIEKLPNSRYIDLESPYLSIDFQQEVNGMECPWNVSQFALVYDSSRVAAPPRTLQELESYVKAYPGTFTVSNDFTGMTLLKSFLAELSGSPTGLNGPFEEEKYLKLSSELWTILNRLKPYFWKGGSTFPKEHSVMDQMFASGELLISYAFGEGGIEDKVRSGLFPVTTRGYVWENGTILNANFLGITYNSSNKAGAMMVINFMISPEAQLKKSDPDGMDSNTVLDLDRLPATWQQQFSELPKRKYGPEMSDIAAHAIQEPDAQYMIRLYDDFRTEVIEK